MLRLLSRFALFSLAFLSLGALGFAFSDYVEDDTNSFIDPLQHWLDRSVSELCIQPLASTADVPIWLQLSPNVQAVALPLFRAKIQPPHSAARLQGADCLYQKTVLRMASEFPEIALSQPYFFKCALDNAARRNSRVQFAIEPIDEVRFKLHWPNSGHSTGSSQFSTTLMQQTDASRCQAR